MNACRGFFKFLFVAFILISGSAYGQDGFISARDFAESQGISYQWFPIQKMLVMRKGLKSVKLTVNDTRATVGDRDVTLPATPVIRDGQIMVPAAAVIRLFQGELNTDPVKTTPPAIQPAVTEPQITVQTTPEPQPQQNLNTAPPVVRPPPPQPPVEAIEEDPVGAVLVALRHSSREDHTRIVLEFSQPITYKTEMSGDNFRLSINGCRNLVPTKRTNPVGRDIKKLDINSGPERSGLILNFTTAQSKKSPIIETVANPFRMIVSFYSDPDAIVATAPAELPPATVTAVVTPAIVKPVETEKPVVKETPPEINIEIPLEKLANESFKGRTVVIDPGHGGSDHGYTHPGRMPEKEITLSVARKLQNSLEKIGLNAVLIRDADIDMPQSQRISVANRHGSDLIVSLHTGSTKSESKAGIACFVYSKSGTEVPGEEVVLTESAVYREWVGKTRFDLSSFLAKRINERLKNQLKAESRGVKQLPLLPLKFLVNPAVLVEVGVLSDPTEGKNLLSSKYHEAIAAAITNGVVDFFNGIVIKP
ncbi:MAG: N-acetylmuramoyl-L-alanine amidase [Candidatus Rifleibacteriota bacterium]